MSVSKTQIDDLGNRLKVSPQSESDLRLLDEYRRSFGNAYEAVVQMLRQRGESPTGRPAKSTVSIIDKLRRQSIRLSQIQDIAGCRVVVPNIVEQDKLVSILKTIFSRTSAIDRRDNPSYGYRAVHVIAEILEKPIEIQVRTSLQHLWAEVSEKSSDVLDPTIKYGGGSQPWRHFLTKSSESVAAYEAWEAKHFIMEAAKTVADATYEDFKNEVANLCEDDLPQHKLQEIRADLQEFEREKILREQQQQEMQHDLELARNENIDLLSKTISRLDELKGQSQ